MNKMKVQANLRLYATSLQIAYSGLASGRVTLDSGNEKQLQQEIENELKRLNNIMQGMAKKNDSQ